MRCLVRPVRVRLSARVRPRVPREIRPPPPRAAVARPAATQYVHVCGHTCVRYDSVRPRVPRETRPPLAPREGPAGIAWLGEVIEHTGATGLEGAHCYVGAHVFVWLATHCCTSWELRRWCKRFFNVSTIMFCNFLSSVSNVCRMSLRT